ncbi:hypothetical protein L207DRAFT_515113 [Hyaloscypha variabilis F]|uniref:Mid2 domain-containing protein n=1 Tax=Hyaloscypha variabilis (strain UAMH 11265 / GT02V1 / F) TaxID=1149755 RepID=A0A2J6RDK7_HYAVF|nr:hypothetical protein L207DRAFT_515113 [Hyaloscypha variabilis F]
MQLELNTCGQGLPSSPSYIRTSPGKCAAAALGAIPSQTIGGCGEPIFAFPLPTEPPSLELAKRRLERKDITGVTNVCTEWTIPGGFGQPECGDYGTCLFTSANGFNYEGCGQTSVAYNWVTECFNYPQSGAPPVSQIYCPETAPYCGYFAFVFGVDYTFWNFGCSTEPYKLFVDLLSTSTSTPIVLAGGGTSRLTPSASATTVYITQQPSSTGATVTVLIPPGASQSGLSTPKSSTPIGAIVGGVIGGIALIALLSFLAWFCLRKRRQDKAFAEAQNRQQRADAAATAARQNENQLPEMGGTPKPAVAYAQTPSPRTGVFPEKPMDEIDNRHLGSQSPPPSYPHSPQSRSSIPSPPSNYTELEAQRTAVGRSPTDPEFWQTGHGGEHHENNELGGTNRGSWNVPPGVQEMSVRTGGINRRPVGPQIPGSGGQYVDMSGAPMSEGYHSHELE